MCIINMKYLPVRNLNTWPWADWNKWLSKKCMCGCTVKDWMTSGFSEMEQVWVLDGYEPGSSHYRITVSSHFWLVSGPITSGMSSINPCISVWMKVHQTTMFCWEVPNYGVYSEITGWQGVHWDKYQRQWACSGFFLASHFHFAGIFVVNYYTI